MTQTIPPAGTTKEIAFSLFEKIEPKELIGFTKEYSDTVFSLKKYAKEQLNTFAEFNCVRMNDHGQLTYRKMKGTVISVDEQFFTLHTNHDFSGVLYEDGFHVEIRFDNPLGIVPVLYPEMDPFTLNAEKLDSYLIHFLRPARKLLKMAEQGENVVKLFFRFDEDHLLYRNGDYSIECTIVKTNNSNVEIKHFKTFAYVSNDEKFVDLHLSLRVCRFITAHSFLRKVIVHFGRSHDSNQFDT